MIKALSGKVGFWWCWWTKKKNVDKEFLIAQVLSRHLAWYPAHNRGKEAPEEAKLAWILKLRVLPKHDLILLIADNHARNCVLGKKWPPVDEAAAGTVESRL